MLEAGKSIDMYKTFKTMEWPYDTPRRGRLEPYEHALNVAEYNMLDRPYGATQRDGAVQEGLFLLGQSLFDAQRRQREGASDHGHALRVGARARARRQDEHVGPRVAAFLRDGSQGEDARRLRRGLADRLCGHLAVLRQGRHAARDQRDEGRHPAPAGRPLPAAVEAERRRSAAEARDREDGAPPDSGTRRRHHRRRAEQVPPALHGTRPLRARMRHQRGVPFADRVDLPRARHRQPRTAAEFDGLRSPLRRERRTRRPACASSTASRARSTTSRRRSSCSRRRRSKRRACSSTRSRATIPNGLANSSGTLGKYFCEHIMGPRASGFLPQLKGKAATLDDGRPQSTYIVRFRNVGSDKQKDFIRGYGFQGSSGCTEFPALRADRDGLRLGLQEEGAGHVSHADLLRRLRRSARARRESGVARSRP